MRHFNSRFAAWLVGWLLLSLSASAQFGSVTVFVTKDIKKDFGAAGDGVTNDQAAFERAAQFFNDFYANIRYNADVQASLTIPKGVYIVGQQDPNAAGHRVGGRNVLDFRNCRNLSIVGEDSASTELRYADNLKYGSFDPVTGQPYYPSGYFDNREYAATIGICISFSNCRNMQVSNLKIDGNSSHYQLGGSWGDTGIQLAADGIFVSESQGITLRNVGASYFGRDGIQVLNHYNTLNPAPTDNISLYNGTFKFNGRQGLSLTGVNGLLALDCRFSGTGKAINIGTNQALSTAPGAGIDFEPENSVVANVIIAGCQVVNNAGGGITADRHTTGIVTQNNLIKNSLVWSVGVHSLWITQPGFSFDNDDVYGYVLHGCDAANDAEATKFRGCRFEDKTYGNQPVTWPFLVHSDGRMRRMSFENCRFTSTRNHFGYLIASTDNSDEYFQFRDCSFIYDHSVLPNVYTHLIGVNLWGQNVFQDGPSRNLAVRSDIMVGAKSSHGQSYWETVKFYGRNTYNLATGTILIGQGLKDDNTATVEVGRDAALVFDGNPASDTTGLFIGKNAVLRVKSRGSLEILANRNVRIAGKLIVEEAAYLCVDPSVKFTLIGSGQVIISPGAIFAPHPTLNASSYYNRTCRTNFGIPVSVALEAPRETPQLDDKVRLDWDALPSGGIGSYTYEWFIDQGDRNGYQPTGDNSNHFSRTVSINDNPCVMVRVTSGGQQADAARCRYDYSKGLSSAAAYPNPANEFVEVVLGNAPAPRASSDAQKALRSSPSVSADATLYNSQGEVKFSGKVEGPRFKLDTRALPDGIYHLRLRQGKQVTSQQIVVKH